MRIAIVGKKFIGSTDSKEKWYGTEYKMSDISLQTLSLWNNCGLNDKLSLPPANHFIPSNLSLKAREQNATIPELIKNTEMSRIWYLQDNEYLKPKVYYGFEFTKY